MKVQQFMWTQTSGWKPELPDTVNASSQLGLLFGSPASLQTGALFAELRSRYPHILLAGCSTAGEIHDTRIYEDEDAVTITLLNFEQSFVKGVKVNIMDYSSSYEAGKKLADSLDKVDLAHVIVFSDGLSVNGSELVQSLWDHLPRNVSITGGLAGDGEQFRRTLVVWEDKAEPNIVSLVGFYGKHLKISYASKGGWDPFGPERLITRACKNVLYKLDNRSALDLYKEYLGDYAKNLPASALLFPLNVRIAEDDIGVVRTILGIDEKNQSMIFSGDIPENAYGRLMKANYGRLINGAEEAAKRSLQGLGTKEAEFALLISCVGRKLVLKQRTEEELEAVRDILGPLPIMTGFYSYGEISPNAPGEKSQLHNQSMTITLFAEK